jgi:hypothetical protein
MTGANESFGCAACMPDDADVAWAALGSSQVISPLIDESHFIVLLRSCSACGQRFVSVFAETVDWADSEDPQFRTVLPVTDQEAATLAATHRRALESALYRIGPDRRSLCRDFPKGAENPSTFWSRGLRAKPHD